MKILIITSYFTPHISGLTFNVEKLSHTLRSLNYDVSVITNQHAASLPRNEKIGKIHILRLPVNFYLSKSPVSGELIKTLIHEIKNNELIILNLPGLESIPASLIAKFFRKKLIAYHHCDPIVPGKLGKLFTLLAASSNLLACFLADRIVTYTEDYALHSPVLKRFPSKEFSILPSITIDQASEKQIQSIREKIGNSKYTIGFAGRISKDKGIQYLLECIPILSQEIKDFKIAFVGPISPVGESYFKELTPLIKKYKKHLVFLGLQSDESEMRAFYSNINLLVLPSINSTEAFGMVQVEALLSGIPIIATDIPGVRQIIKLTNGGIVVPPRSSRELAKAIIFILKKKFQFKIKNLDLFSQSNYAKHINQLIKSLP